MERAASLERLREAPAGRFVVGPGWIHFCAHHELWGVVLFGRADRGSATELVRSIGAELGPDVPRHGSYIDARRLDGVDPGAYTVLLDHVHRTYDASAARFTRLALVCPPGFEGAVVAGFYGTLPPPCPVRMFERSDEALAWLGETGAALDRRLHAILAEVVGTSPLLDSLRALLREQLVAPDCAALGRALGLSERTLQRRLQEEGTSFLKEVQRARIDEACRRLRDTDDALTVVALEVGFASPQHFSARFRVAVGESPSAWRGRHRGQ